MKFGDIFDDAWKDLRYALRWLRRSPGFTLTAVAALALGIGATTAVFSVVNTVLLKPVPYPHPNRIVLLDRHFPEGQTYILSIPDFMAMRKANRSLEDFALFDFNGPGVNLTGGGHADQVKGIHASANYFRVFGTPFALGRPYSAAEDVPDGPHVVVISYGLWKSRYGGNRDIIGRPIQVGKVPYLVTGVVGRDFHPNPRADIWLPLEANPDSTNHGNYLLGAALLKPGATLAAASAELSLTTAALRRKFPGTLQNKEVFGATLFQQAAVGHVGSTLYILLGAVCFVLLIACANVANLLLARATLRKREIALRAALGAGRGRIIRQLLTESVVLSVAGSVVGLVLGFVGVRALLAINPGDIPRIGEHGSAVTLDWHVLLFALLVAVATGVLFGLIPALNATRSDLHTILKESASRGGTGFRHNKSRSLLVVTEMALALVLLTGAGLLIRTLVAMRRVDPGFQANHVLTMEMSLTGPRFQKTAGVAVLAREAEQRVGSVPGVVAVSASSSIPLEPEYGLPFDVVGRPLTGKSRFTGGADWVSVSPQFFKVFRIPLYRGRVFNDQDTAAAPPVVIIDEALAKEYWPKGGALGQQMLIGKGVGPEFKNERARQIVGIVGDVRDYGLNRKPPPIMYVPIAQVTNGFNALVNRVSALVWSLRTRVPPFSLATEIRSRLRDASGGLPVAHIESMNQVIAESTARTDFDMVLLTIFAGIALLLAGIGIYGLVAYSVDQRTQEMGIRMALGASPGGVRNLVVRQGMVLALVGVAIGIGASLALTRLIAGMLYGVKPWDPMVLAGVACLLCLIALLATYVPARRASRIDPSDALRYE